MTYAELQELFWGEVAAITAGLIKKPDKFIRWCYPESGAPDWKISDDILFLYLSEADDDYAKQRDSMYRTDRGTVYRDTIRTRVWDLQTTAYGRRSYELVNLLKDGFFMRRCSEILHKKMCFSFRICRPAHKHQSFSQESGGLGGTLPCALTN